MLDTHSNHILFEEAAAAPTSLIALNVALYFGCQDSKAVSLADAAQAFPQANLAEAGELDTWVILPEELRLEPPGSTVAVRLKKSLYGHPLAGRLRQRHLLGGLLPLGVVLVQLLVPGRSRHIFVEHMCR